MLMSRPGQQYVGLFVGYGGAPGYGQPQTSTAVKSGTIPTYNFLYCLSLPLYTAKLTSMPQHSVDKEWHLMLQPNQSQ